MTLFLYGTSLPGQPDHRWVVGRPLVPATVRGSLWRGPRNRPGLLLEDGRQIHGALVDIEDAQVAVMDLVETVGGGVLERMPVRASVNLRLAHAFAWVLVGKPPKGWRKLATDSWAGLGR